MFFTRDFPGLIIVITSVNAIATMAHAETTAHRQGRTY
jgi:hypothetical protein